MQGKKKTVKLFKLNSVSQISLRIDLVTQTRIVDNVD